MWPAHGRACAVDNLTQFLPQERVGEFAVRARAGGGGGPERGPGRALSRARVSQKLSPQELLVETEKAIDEELYMTHLELGKVEHAKVADAKDLADLEKRMTHVAGVIESTKSDAEKVAKRDDLIVQVDLLEARREQVELAQIDGKVAELKQACKDKKTEFNVRARAGAGGVAGRAGMGGGGLIARSRAGGEGQGGADKGAVEGRRRGLECGRGGGQERPPSGFDRREGRGEVRGGGGARARVRARAWPTRVPQHRVEAHRHRVRRRHDGGLAGAEDRSRRRQEDYREGEGAWRWGVGRLVMRWRRRSSWSRRATRCRQRCGRSTPCGRRRSCLRRSRLRARR